MSDGLAQKVLADLKSMNDQVVCIVSDNPNKGKPFDDAIKVVQWALETAKELEETEDQLCIVMDERDILRRQLSQA